MLSAESGRATTIDRNSGCESRASRRFQSGRMQIKKNVLRSVKKVDKKNSCFYKQQHIVCLVVLYTMMLFDTASCGRDKNFEERRLTRWLKQQQRSPQQRSRRPSPPRRQP